MRNAFILCLLIGGAVQAQVFNPGAAPPAVTADANQITAGTLSNARLSKNVQNRIGESLNVKTYGATGDGITDDTAAFQSAIDDANSLGDVPVIVPNGVYKWTSTVVGHSGTKLLGVAGRPFHSQSGAEYYPKIVFDPIVSEDNCFELADNGQTYIYGLTVENLAFFGQTDGTTGDCFYLDRPGASQLRNLVIFHFENGISISKGIDNRISSCHIQSYQADRESGVRIRDAGTGVTTTTYIVDCYFSGHQYSKILENALHTTVINTVHESADYGALDMYQKSNGVFYSNSYGEDIPNTGGAYPIFNVGVNGTGATGFTGTLTIFGGSWQGTASTVDAGSSLVNADYSASVSVYGATVTRVGTLVKSTANTLRINDWCNQGPSVADWLGGISDKRYYQGDEGGSGGILGTRRLNTCSVRYNYGTNYWVNEISSGILFWGNGSGNHMGLASNGYLGLGGELYPSSELDIGGGTKTYVDGDDDLLVKDDVEIDGDLYVEGSMNLLSYTTTFDFPSIPDGGFTAYHATLNGASMGDVALASLSIDVNDLQLTANVTASNFVTALVTNNTGAAVDLDSCTLKISVIK